MTGLRISWIQSLALMVGLCASVTTIEAMAGPRVNAENEAKNGLDFELSDGQQFVQLSKLPAQTTVINFWRFDCPPCIREMPLLAAQARGNKTRIVTIALHKPGETLAAPAAVQSALHPPTIALNGPGEPRGLLARFGNRHGALPHTLVLDAHRRPCAQRTGEITQDWLETAIAHCSTS